MNLLFEQNKTFFQKVDESRTHDDLQQGETGFLNADGTVNSNPTQGLTSPNIWVRLNNGRVAVPVVNTTVASNVAELAVWTGINRRTRLREITSIDTTKAFSKLPADVVLSAATPDKTSDAQDVASLALEMGRIEPTQPESLSVYPRSFLYGGIAYGNTTVDLTAVEAALAVNTKVLTVVGFDTVALGFTYLSGTARSLAYPLTGANALAEAALVVTDNTVIRLGAVVIQEGQIAISWSSLTDIREWLRALFAAPGAFDVDSIMTDSRGNVMSDSREE